MNSANPLLNKTILITRPVGREVHLRQLIEQAGGKVIHYPVISINPPTDLEIAQLMQLRERLQTFTMAIFISPTAVEQSQLYFPVLPEHLSIASLGKKTTQALEKHHVKVDVEAPEYNSESLLKTKAFQMPEIQGQRILIFRGNGGLAHLGDTLIKRKAQIRYVETYHRQLPALPPLTLQQIKTLDAVAVSSSEGLENLITLVDNPGLLVDTPLIVPSPRSVTLARQHGFKHIVAAENATDEATVLALNNCLN